MVYVLVLVIHIFVSLVLIAVILLQSGRGGLSEAMGGAAAQSLFGGGAANVLTRMTAICAGLFVVTCLSLAYLSTVRGQSVIEQVPLISPEVLPSVLPPPTADHPSESAPPVSPPADSSPAPTTESSPTSPSE